MTRTRKLIAAVALVIAGTIGLTGCLDDDADVVNHNIDKAAKNFEINRRVVVVNSITDKYLLEIEGRCDITPKTGRVLVTCKVADGDGPDSYKRHQVYKSDNVAVVVEQLEPIKASAYHYRFTFKPQAIVPDVDFKGSTSDLPETDGPS